MKVIEVKDWNDFEAKLEELNAEVSQLRKKSPYGVSELLFRGQSNSKWGLETTLERYLGRKITVITYYDIIHQSES